MAHRMGSPPGGVSRCGFLPDELPAEKKQGFGLPFGVWANGHAELRKLAAESLQSLAGRGIVWPAFIDTLRRSIFRRIQGIVAGWCGF